MQTATPAPARRRGPDSPEGSGDGWTQSSSPTEIYDIGCDSDDGIGNISSAVRALDIDGDLAPWHDRSPCSSRKGPTYDASTAPSSCHAPDGPASSVKAEEADAWNVEDWDSHLAQLREVATPCRASLNNDELKAAEVVKAELQAEVELLVQDAMDEMRSWLSQEIAFARCNIEEAKASAEQNQGQNEVMALHRRVEEQGEALEKLQENGDVEKLRKELQEQARIVRRLDEATSITSDGRGATSSDRVMEARAVAEERKWRLRLETIESSLARNAEHIEACNQRTLELQERAALNEADLQRGLCSSQSAERQCMEATTEISALRTCADKQADDLRQLESQLRCLTAELATTKDAKDSAKKHIGQLEESLSALRIASNEQSSTQRQHKEEMLSFGTQLQEVLASVAACRTEALASRSKMDAVSQQSEDACRQVSKTDQQFVNHVKQVRSDMEELRAHFGRSETLLLQVQSQEASLSKFQSQFSQLETRVSSLNSVTGKRLDKLEREVSTTEAELSTMQNCLENHSAHLANLDKQRLSLAAKAALQEEQLGKIWAAVEGLESQAHSEHKEVLHLSKSLKENGHGLEAVRAEMQEHSKATQGRISAQDAHLKQIDHEMETQEEKCQNLRSALEDLEAKVRVVSDLQHDTSECVKKTSLEVDAAKTESQQQVKALETTFQDRLEMQHLQNSRYDEILENLLQQNTSLLDQAFEWDADIKCTTQRTGVLQEKAELLDAELESIRCNFTRCMSQQQEQIESMQRSQSNACEVASQLQQDMSTQVSRVEMQQMHAELQDWVTRTRQAMDRWLSSSLDKFQKEQGLVLQDHRGWMHRVKRWVEKIHVREQGLSHLILHILQEGSPDMVKLLEEALRMPRKPSAQDTSLE